jgi:hypothetical protein
VNSGLHAYNVRALPGALPPVHFALVVLEMGSHKLFAILLISAFQISTVICVSHVPGRTCVLKVKGNHFEQCQGPICILEIVA